MGSRGRSIRLRIYFLVAIPLITMLGLFGYVAYTSINNWLNLDRAPNLIRATSVPLTNFVSLLQAERRAAVVYLSQPSAANLDAYQTAITTTKNGELPLDAALSSAGTRNSTTASETAAISKMNADIDGMTSLRTAVTARQLQPLAALAAYTKIIADQDTVFQAEANSITDASAASQGLGLIATINAREDVSEQDAVLAGALASGSLTGADRVAFSQAAGRQQDDMLLYSALLSPAELKTFNSVLNAQVPTTLQSDLTQVQQAVAAGITLKEMAAKGLSPSTWQLLTSTWQKANYNAGTDAANAVLDIDQNLAISAKDRVWETGGVGAAGLIITLIVTILLGRSINRRLTRLRRSALTLAEEQLPAVVARLRRGEHVDIAAEAPPLRVGGDEIGQVGQAIDMVRQTAIRAAVEEARLRQGVNDVFRNLARRNQSLLQRQLTVLDSMERRATDPDVLEDLFKMDHLTTRMRRHAEGLIILSGAAPGRSWSAPVRLIDVMRGAVAEVEDYARVAVSTQSKAALTGSAVTDVIHLLAELIENATTLSPPFTQVRVSGESVANGFAIEIEDRGLGMTPQRMAELNERLANPPDINPANTEQLGLFVVGQLARRHGVSVTLRPSPYGGVTAVTLIPQRLLVDELPAAITAGGAPAIGGQRAGMDGAAHGPSSGPDGASGSYQPYGSAGSYSSAGAYGGYSGSADGYPAAEGYPGNAARYAANPGGFPADGGAPGNGGGYAGSGGGYGRSGQYGATAGFGDGAAYPEPPLPGRIRKAPAAPTAASAAAQAGPPAVAGSPSGSTADRAALPVRRDPYADQPVGGAAGTPAEGFRVSGPVRQSVGQGSGEDGAAAPGAGRGRHGASDVPVVTGVPVSRPTAPSFDVFTPLHRPQEGGPAAPATAGSAPYAESYTDGASSYGSAPQGAEGYGSDAVDAGSHGNTDGQGDGASDDYKGLPRRVRQASLAPQLRSSATAAAASGSSGVPRATAASLTDMRNTLSAMQRGWQQGRSQSQRETEGGSDDD
jgi:Nitrate and nitrite sensing/Histidine kinase-, DNA gyrase B-, and HSP90-like ATPase